MVATTNPSDRFSETTTVALARSWQPRAAQEVIISAARDSQRAHTTDSLSIGLFAIEFHALQHKFGTHAPLIRKTFFSQIACCKRWPLVVFVTSELLLTPQENHTHLASHTLALPCQEICDYRSFHAKKPCSKCTDLLVERRHWILRAVKKKNTSFSNRSPSPASATPLRLEFELKNQARAVHFNRSALISRAQEGNTEIVKAVQAPATTASSASLLGVLLNTQNVAFNI